MKKTVLPKRYQTRFYNSRHLRVDLLNRMKEMRGKLKNSVEGVMNQALAVGLPLLEAEYGDERQNQRKKGSKKTTKDIDVLRKEKNQETSHAVTRFDWTLAPGVCAHLEIIGNPSAEDREFLKLCLDRAMKKLSESKGESAPKE